MKPGNYRRVVELHDVRADQGEERAVSASLSSEFPVERFGGVEVLEHTAAAVDLSRAANGLALLWDHQRGEMIGRADQVRLAGGKLRARLRFGSSARARELFEDVKAGIVRDVSVGYEISEVRRERDPQDPDRTVFRVTKWTPYEASLLAMAADPSVGVGRGKEPDEMTRTRTDDTRDDDRRDDDRRDDDGGSSHRARATVRSAERAAVHRERERSTEIRALGDHWKCRERAERAIEEGQSVEAFRAFLLNEYLPDRRSLRTPASEEIGFSEGERERYSLLRLIRAQADPRLLPEAGLELEASRAIEQKLGRQARGWFVPFDAFRARERSAGDLSTRDLTKGGSGGNLVATELLAESFIELLRNRARVLELGAMPLSGLVGDVEIPRQTDAAAAQWLAEGGSVTGTDATFDVVPMSPKTLAAKQIVSRKMLLQSSPMAEDLVRSDLQRVLAVALDLAAIRGDGTGNQPVGLLNTSGIGLVPLGAPDGGPPTWDAIVALESEVAIDNADEGALGFLTNAQVRGRLRTLEKAASTAEFVWEPGPDRRDGSVAGYRALVSQNVPSDLTKGAGTNLSAMLFGDWSSLVIGEWGVLDVSTDPYTLGDQGALVVRAFLDADIAVRTPQSFAVITDMVTTP